MKKIFVLDTNVLLHDPRALFAFTDNEVVIPLVVLDELDKKKNGHDEIARHARMTIRSLDDMREECSLHEGVATRVGGVIRVEIGFSDCIPKHMDQTKTDNQIIGVTLGLREANSGVTVILVTKDINLRVKCDALGVGVEDYNTDSVVDSVEELYSGFIEIEMSYDSILDLRNDGFTQAPDKIKLYENQYVLVRSEIDGEDVELARYSCGNLASIVPKSNIWGINPRNLEQTFAFDALFDPNIKLVTMTGLAGGGKTLISAAAGVAQTLDMHVYRKLIMTRPVVPLGRDIGFLPGPQPLDAKILTPDGWTTMGEVSPGDYVIGRSGAPTLVKKIFPKGKKKVFAIHTTDGTSTECCIDHLWHTRTKEDKKRGRSGSVVTTAHIMDTIADSKGKPNHYLPRNGPVEYSKNKLSIPPYLLGVILGDGSISNNVNISNIDDELISRASEEVDSIGCKLSHSSGIIYTIVEKIPLYNNKPARPVRITNIISGEIQDFKSIGPASSIGINRSTLADRCNAGVTMDDKKYEFLKCTSRWQNSVKDKLYSMGLVPGTGAVKKFIPDIYKFSSIDDRINVLRGLMDSDGTIKTNGESSFCTVSERLANDVVEIVRSLGGRATARSRDRIGVNGKINGRGIMSNHITYEFTISLPQDINPFYISRKADRHKCKYIHDSKIERIEEVGEKDVQCILVEDDEHLYITDDFIVTHNTKEDKMAPWMAPLQDNLDLLFSDKGKDYLAMEQGEGGRLQVEAITYIRGRSIPKTYIILDEAQNITRHEMKTIITRVGEDSKIVLTGDIMQIDCPFIDAVDNGLSYVIEKFKDDPIAAHIGLKKGERSELATKAAELL